MKKKIHLVEEFYTFGCGRCELGGTPDCKVHTWEKELQELRKLALACGLEETLKWSFPCFTYEGKNIVLLAAFSDYCSLSFFNGALLKDPEGILVFPGENSRIARLAKFTNITQIRKSRSTLTAYIKESIELSRKGIKPAGSKDNKLEFPPELVEAFKADASLKKAFLALTPGRQRGYVIHFSQAKQSKTRQSRIENSRNKIMNGLGYFDK